MSGIERSRDLRSDLGRLRRCRRGAVALEYALILPVFIGLSFGVMDVTLVLFDYHQLAEATRRGARQAVIEPPIPSLATLANGPITCTGSTPPASTGVTCTASLAAPAGFANILAAMRSTVPDLAGTQVRVAYADSGLTGGEATPGLRTPLVTVSVTGVTHAYTFLQAVPGVGASFRFPAFTTSLLAPSGSYP